MTLQAFHLAHGAQLAPDGIPLQYGDLADEYHAALNRAVLMDRSHEGRLILTGRDRLALPHRISTHDVESLPVGAGRPTLFTNPNARILDRAVIFNLGERVLALAEPGRGPALMAYVQRNVFFNDDLKLHDLAGETHAFALHGPAVSAIMGRLHPALADLHLLHAASLDLDGVPLIAACVPPVSINAWVVIVPQSHSDKIITALLSAGAADGLRLAGSLTYNLLRIRAGRPGVGRELSADYIPLEIGLWDEVSFTKGCYTGQEIIARMESRQRLARTIVRLRLTKAVTAPADLKSGERSIGSLTSSVTTPDGQHLGIGVVRLAYAQPGSVLDADSAQATIIDLAGVQPPSLREETDDG